MQYAIQTFAGILSPGQDTMCCQSSGRFVLGVWIIILSSSSQYGARVERLASVAWVFSVPARTAFLMRKVDGVAVSVDRDGWVAAGVQHILLHFRAVGKTDSVTTFLLVVVQNAQRHPTVHGSTVLLDDLPFNGTGTVLQHRHPDVLLYQLVDLTCTLLRRRRTGNADDGEAEDRRDDETPRSVPARTGNPGRGRSASGIGGYGDSAHAAFALQAVVWPCATEFRRHRWLALGEG